MALTIDTNLAGKIISSNALEAFTNRLAPLQAFSTSFDNDAGQIGDRIEIPFVTKFGNDGTSTVSAFNTSSNDYATAGSAEIEAVTVSLGNHVKTTWSLQDVQATEYATAQLERFGNQKGNDLASKIFTDVSGKWIADNFSNNTVVGVASAFDLDALLEARASVVSRGANPSDCSVLLSSSHYNALLGDSSFQADAYGGSEAIRQGVIPAIAGFQAVYECPQMPNTDNLVGVITHPSALAVAFRYLAPSGSGSGAYTRTDRLTNDLGMTMGYRQFYQPETGIDFATLEAVYGYSVVNGDAAELLLSVGDED
jgi:hypothetical protein